TGVGETNREHRGAAADLELTGVELRRVGVRRALDELDIEPVRGVELLRLDHRRHKGAKRRKTEYHDSEFRRLLRDGRARYSERCERERGDGAQLRPQGHCHFCSSSKSLFCHVGLWPFVLSLILNSRAASPPLMESVCVLD